MKLYELYDELKRRIETGNGKLPVVIEAAINDPTRPAHDRGTTTQIMEVKLEGDQLVLVPDEYLIIG